jgi:hypothetical protein
MYYKLGIESSSKKWEEYENISPYLEINDIELSAKKLLKNPDYFRTEKNLKYENLKDGKIPPVSSLGSSFILFSGLIENISTLDNEKKGSNLIPIKNRKSENEYLILNVVNSVDCVDWDLSDIDRWPLNSEIDEWNNKRGRFFIKPVLIKSKIPSNLEIFSLSEWGGAFNIVISQDYKNKIEKLNFDSSFLVFIPLELR